MAEPPDPERRVAEDRTGMDWEIPLFKIQWDEADVEAVSGAIRAGRDWAIGPNVEKFEQALASYVGSPFALVMNSGTSALHAAMLAHGIGEGDEVIVPSFTFISTANAPLFVGAKPVFADIEESTFGLDPEAVSRKVTGRTRALIPVHYGGCSCRIQELRQIADEHRLVLIEDAAESLGAKVRGKNVGTFGDSAIISFCGPKVITTGEGGALLTGSRDVFEKARLTRSHGRLETRDYFSTSEYMDYVEVGYNFRMSNIVAALGISQLEKVDRIIELRRANAARYDERLSRIEGIKVISPPEGYERVFQMYTIEVGGGRERRDALSAHLNKAGIMTKVYFEPVHLTHFYRTGLGYSDDLPVTEGVSSRVLSLPMYPSLTADEIDAIAESIADFFKVEL
jgi:perosamine synthetase